VKERWQFLHNDRWYYTSNAAYEGYATKGMRSNVDHIGRIMESELGMQLVREQVCDGCRTSNPVCECWVYDPSKAKGQVRVTLTCAHCRSKGDKCSLSKRKTEMRPQDVGAQPSPAQVQLVPTVFAQPGPLVPQMYPPLAPAPPQGGYWAFHPWSF
jgi:hypothetical protein